MVEIQYPECFLMWLIRWPDKCAPPPHAYAKCRMTRMNFNDIIARIEFNNITYLRDQQTITRERSVIS